MKKTCFALTYFLILAFSCTPKRNLQYYSDPNEEAGETTCYLYKIKESAHRYDSAVFQVWAERKSEQVFRIKVKKN